MNVDSTAPHYASVVQSFPSVSHSKVVLVWVPILERLTFPILNHPSEMTSLKVSGAFRCGLCHLFLIFTLLFLLLSSFFGLISSVGCNKYYDSFMNCTNTVD